MKIHDIHRVVIDNVEPVSKNGSVKLVFTTGIDYGGFTVTGIMYQDKDHFVDVYFLNQDLQMYTKRYFRIISLTFKTEP